MTQTKLAATAAQTTRENPWPLALLTQNIKRYVERMSALWVSGQVVEYRRRSGARMAFFTLRDLEESTSMTVKCFASVISQAGPAFDEGASVVICCKPDFYEGNGQLSLHATQIHLLGTGNLLAAIEQLRRKLEAEGLFAASRKRALPVIPRRIGLICGRNAKARQDVIVNATARWPGAEFEVREVAVQGPYCAAQVGQALVDLDADPGVDVIVITRGGGAVEDLLPFSDESLVRSAAAAKTPLVSAIGHESDAPLLDLVADFRASTPTHAARAIVPDWQREHDGVAATRTQIRARIRALIQAEQQALADLRMRPVLRSPLSMIEIQDERVRATRQRMAALMGARIQVEAERLGGLTSSLRALSPRSVMERGYTIVRLPGKRVVTDYTQVKRGDAVELLFARGVGLAQIVTSTPGLENPKE